MAKNMDRGGNTGKRNRKKLPLGHVVKKKAGKFFPASPPPAPENDNDLILGCYYEEELSRKGFRVTRINCRNNTHSSADPLCKSCRRCKPKRKQRFN